MKKKQSLSTGISALIVAVLIVIAFFRGDIQVWLLSSVLVVWGLWATITYLLPRIRKTQKEKRRMERRNKHEQASISERGFYVPELSDDPVGLVLKRHVNHRISAYLRSVYSDATWEWCEEQPEHIIAKGGTGRIQIYGVPDFNYAEVKLDQHAKTGRAACRDRW